MIHFMNHDHIGSLWQCQMSQKSHATNESNLVFFKCVYISYLHDWRSHFQGFPGVVGTLSHTAVQTITCRIVFRLDIYKWFCRGSICSPVACRLLEFCSGDLILVSGSLTWPPKKLRLSLKFVWIFQCWLQGLVLGIPDFMPWQSNLATEYKCLNHTLGFVAPRITECNSILGELLLYFIIIRISVKFHLCKDSSIGTRMDFRSRPVFAVLFSVPCNSFYSNAGKENLIHQVKTTYHYFNTGRVTVEMENHHGECCVCKHLSFRCLDEHGTPKASHPDQTLKLSPKNNSFYQPAKGTHTGDIPC